MKDSPDLTLTAHNEDGPRRLLPGDRRVKYKYIILLLLLLLLYIIA